MFTAKVTAPVLKQVNEKLDNIIKNIRDTSRKLLSTCNTYEEASNKLYEYIYTSCETESRTISSSLYSDLYNQISNSGYFSNVELVNEFYSLDMRNYLSENCKFELEKKFTYSPKDIKKTSIIVAGGIAVVGSVISLMLILPMGIIPSVIVGGVAYPVTSKIIDRKNFENYLFTVEVYLKELKKKFLSWIESFEEYYSETMEGLIQKCRQ
ncbi:MAG: hypothetical protein ACI4WH_03425 [Oscillospiraceae bacterium]